jgi:hypothetical protein
MIDKGISVSCHFQYSPLGITSIPDNISKLNKLKRVNLANNKGLNKISPNISSLGVLEELSLTNCDIKLMPETISQLPNLEKLNLSVKYVFLDFFSIAHLVAESLIFQKDLEHFANCESWI